MIQSIALFFTKLYSITIKNALYALYREGPAFHGYGFWQGHSDNFICSSLTRYSGINNPTYHSAAVSQYSTAGVHEAANFWSLPENGQACRNIINADFRQYEITLLAVIYGWWLYQIMSLVWKGIATSLCSGCKCWLCRLMKRFRYCRKCKDCKHKNKDLNLTLDQNGETNSNSQREGVHKRATKDHHRVRDHANVTDNGHRGNLQADTKE